MFIAKAIGLGALLVASSLLSCGGRDEVGREHTPPTEDGSDPADRSIPASGDRSTPNGQVEVPRFATAEIVFQASKPYAADGEPNPFLDVRVEAAVTAPSGQIRTVEGFFDGDGRGGPAGDLFKIRLCPDEAGVWMWQSRSNDASLDGLDGTFVCEGICPGAFGQGPIVVDPEHPRYFRHQDGPSVYLLGKFLDIDAPDRLRFSHTMFSENLEEEDRCALLDRHLRMGLNKINVYLANKGDYDGIPTTPWLGSASSNEKMRFDLSRWRRYEDWAQKIRDAGVILQIWFFADDSGFRELSGDEAALLIRYGMARLSAFANTVLILALEWQEDWTPIEVDAQMSLLHRCNPWDRLASVHGITGDFAFPDAPWADFLDIQAGNDADHATVHLMGLSHRALAERPLIQEEFGVGREDRSNRRKAWAAFMAGAAGSGTGGYLIHLARFAREVPFPRMEPADGLVVMGGAYLLADPGEEYAAYLHDGGTIRLDMTSAAGSFFVRWYDPRTGRFGWEGEVEGGGIRELTAPDDEDWAVRIRRGR